MVLIQRKGENDGGEGGTFDGMAPEKKKRRGRGESWGGAALGFRLFRCLAL